MYIKYMKDKKVSNLTNVLESEDLNKELIDAIIKHKIKLEEDENGNTVESCCVKLDRRAVQYFTQIIIISIVLFFSMAMLTNNGSCENQRPYTCLLSLMLGLIIPNPKFKK